MNATPSRRLLSLGAVWRRLAKREERNNPRRERVILSMTMASRRLAVIVALAAMLLRGLLPDGWMPSAQTGAPLIACPGQGPMHMHMPMAPGGSHGHTSPGHSSSVCPFAAVAHLSLPLANVPGAAPALIAFNFARIPAARVIAQARIYRSQSPRAPPRFA